MQQVICQDFHIDGINPLSKQMACLILLCAEEFSFCFQTFKHLYKDNVMQISFQDKPRAVDFI